MPTKLIVRRPPDFIPFRKKSIEQGIHQRFEEQVTLHPNNIAMKTRDCAHTYAQANGLANSLAAEILSAGGKKLSRAAILLPNTPDVIIAILAAMKAHKTYVPLDPNFPNDRLRIMFDDADPSVLITNDDHVALAEELSGNKARIINTSQLKFSADAPNPLVACDPLDLAYILYTSGSTGRPKGIAFLHRNLLHTTRCLTNELFWSPSDRVTWLHSASFAASVVDIYCALTNGGALYPWDAKSQGFTGLADWYVNEKVTTFQWIPSAFRQFLRTVDDDFVFQDIRIVVMASESLTVREVELFRRHFPTGSHLVNQVGTSESYNYRLYPVDHEIPIENANVAGGYSVSEDREVLILDEERQPLSVGNIGEIGVKSEYMSGGYWCDPALTQSKFIRVGDDPTPVYLTGDLGKLESDGCLIHLGRKDFQVKIRGYRVELAEIDQVLTTAKGIADSAAWVVKNRLGEDQLVGYVLLKEAGKFDQPAVEKFLESQLPDYMVPRHYVVLTSFPVLPTGKVDRKSLPNPFISAEAGTAAQASEPASLEEQIVNLFKELLQLKTINADSNFLKLGGDSLLVAILAHRIHQCFKVELKVEDIIESPTPAHVASLLRKALESSGIHVTNEPQPKASVALGSLTSPRVAIETGSRLGFSAGADKTVKNLIIISAGKFGRETFAWATKAILNGAPFRIKGFLDNRPNALDGFNYEPRILGDVQNYRIEENDVFVGAIGNPCDKVKYYSPIIERGGKFVNVIHPLANIGPNVKLGNGIVLAPFVSITCDVTIGDHVSVGAFSNLGHDVVVGDWSQISSHCGLNGNVKLGEGVFVGSHACLVPQIKISDWAFVGAGSVVIRHVEPCVKVFGNPAAVIGKADKRP